MRGREIEVSSERINIDDLCALAGCAVVLLYCVATAELLSIFPTSRA